MAHDRHEEEDAMDIDSPDTENESSPIARQTLQKLQERAPDQCGGMNLSHFLYLCSYLKILLGLGYKSPHGALDAFITLYPSWAILSISSARPYHVWFLEHGPNQVPIGQVLSNYILAEICQENSSHVQSLNDSFSNAVSDFAQRNPSITDHVEVPRFPLPPPDVVALQFLYTPRLEHVACHGIPAKDDVVQLSTALDPTSNSLRVTVKRGEVVVGQISETDKTRSLRYLGSEAVVIETQEYTSLGDGGRCCNGLVVVKGVATTEGDAA